MDNIIKKIYADKKEYKEQMARVEAFPEDYQFVFEKIQDYMWSFAGGSGMDMLRTQYELIDLFESGIFNGKHVLDITGKDVAEFCDGLICDNKLWTDNIRNRLNRRMDRRFKKNIHD